MENKIQSQVESQILTQIKDELKQHNDTVLEANPNYANTQPKLIELLECYWNSKYRDIQDEVPFYNIVDAPVWVAAKGIDIDRNDIKVTAEDRNSEWGSFLMEKELRFWMKEKKFGAMLNDIVFNLSKYGTIVLKKIGDEIYNVYIKNIIIDPTVEFIKDSPYIIEKHEYSIAKFQEVGKKKGWNNVDEIVSQYRANKKTKVLVCERYGDYGGEYNYCVVAGADLDKKTESLGCWILFEGNRDPNYREVHWEKVPGRWLGRGNVEKLLEPQRAANEVNYYFHKGLQWTSLRIFQTRDEMAARNLLSELENGDVLRTLNEITPVATEEKNLSAFAYADSKWTKNIADRSFAQEPVSGQGVKSGVPLGSTQLSIGMSGQYFGFKQEILGMFIEDLIVEWIIPTFKKSNGKEHKVHLMKLMGDDLASEKFFNLLLSQQLWNKRITLLAKGKVPLGKEWEMFKAIETDRLKHSDYSIPDGLYDDINYKINVSITAEKINLSSKVAVAQIILQILGSNPAVFQDPTTRRIANKVMEWSGINPKGMLPDEIVGVTEFAGQARAQVGGSIAAPQAPTQQPQITQETNQL
jgi:hypothetical protein